MRIFLLLFIILGVSCAYANETREQQLRRLCEFQPLQTQCQDLPQTVEEMKAELERLQVEHQLEQARNGIFSEPIKIQQPDVIVTTYFEEE